MQKKSRYHVYFDANFFQKLTKIPRMYFEPMWQENVVQYINNELLPIRCICPPLNFLELIGRTSFPHPILPPLKIPGTLSGRERGKFVQARLLQNFEISLEFYKGLEELKPESIIFAAAMKRFRYMSFSPSTEIFFEETIKRFINIHRNFDSIYERLALDRLQSFVTSSSSDDFVLCTIQYLREFLNPHAIEGNFPVFRCLGSAWKRMEPLIFVKGTLFKLIDGSDLGDTEYLHFAITGLNENGRRFAVAVLTMDPPETVRARLSVAKYLLKQFTELFDCSLETFKFLPGRVICFDKLDTSRPVIIDVREVKESISVGIFTGLELKKNFKRLQLEGERLMFETAA